MRLIILLLLASTAYAGNHCYETSHIVGRQKCAVFGMWSIASRLPAITLDEELLTETLPIGNTTTWRTRVTWPIVKHLFMGSEFDIGGANEYLATGIRGVLGVRTLVGDTTLSTELAGGERTIDMIGTSKVIEARMRFDWWATPHLTLGFALGTSLIADDASALFSIGMHVRAFDGGT
ncbi:MAG: hypothetical protein QM831_17920 [Kofleriaceae bacterium]